MSKTLYPVLAAIDPQTLNDPLRDELQWFQALAEPVLPIPDLSSLPSHFNDEELIGAAAPVADESNPHIKREV